MVAFFAGLDHDDPYKYLTKFYEIYMSGALETEEEMVFLRLFPHSFIVKAKEWYLDQLASMMTNHDVLEEKFLNRFFPHNKFMEAKTTTVVFYQGTTENICETWEKYKSMTRRCTNHGFDDLK